VNSLICIQNLVRHTTTTATGNNGTGKFVNAASTRELWSSLDLANKKIDYVIVWERNMDGKRDLLRYRSSHAFSFMLLNMF